MGFCVWGWVCCVCINDKIGLDLLGFLFIKKKKGLLGFDINASNGFFVCGIGFIVCMGDKIGLDLLGKGFVGV